MDSFEINKIIAAVLLTALILIGIGKFFSYKIKSACYWELYIKEKKLDLSILSFKD